MTTRKRKSPEKKKQPAVRQQGLVVRGLVSGARAAGHLLVRHPAGFGGAAAFAVVFSFVAANAMWYQPGTHPSPFLRTRLPLGAPQLAGNDKNGEEESQSGLTPRKVTTFVIEREGVPGTAADAATPRASGLVLEIQKQLAIRGFFEGDADGLSGPKTSSAIARFERQSGRVETGLANAETLALLLQGPETEPETKTATTTKVATADPVTIPRERPFEEANNATADPVAAAILNAEADGQFTPRAEIPAPSGIVMKIQKGLSNIAYADISVDGVAGEQTRAAIRHFEKHYRLPETGQPNEKVLKKLKEIGAL